MIQNFSGARVLDIFSSSPLDFFVSIQQSENSQTESGEGWSGKGLTQRTYMHICKTNEDNSAGMSEEEVNGGK